MQDKAIELAKQRRSYYTLGKDLPISNDEIIELVKGAVKSSPTAFNNQTVRAVILFNDNHDKLWDMTVERLRPEVPTEEAFENTKKKIAAFKAAAGTVLFFRDDAIVHQNEHDFALYADNFHDWAEQGLGGVQQLLWTSFKENNVGANLQHYNPLIDEKVAQMFDIPDNWVLRAQMVFGSIAEEEPAEKEKLPDGEVFKVFE